jgi:hypothetical protein
MPKMSGASTRKDCGVKFEGALRGDQKRFSRVGNS